jgi:tRNA A37 methylthiotransferase MiaB
MSRPKKKVYIKTFGCQMNVADSDHMAQVLAPDYVVTTQADEADLYLVNTCAIREKSEQKVRSLLGSLKALKRQRPHLILGVGGCVAQQEGERLLAAVPHLDLVFGTHGIYRLPELVRQATQECQLDVALREGFPVTPPRRWQPAPPRPWSLSCRVATTIAHFAWCRMSGAGSTAVRPGPSWPKCRSSWPPAAKR